MKVSAARAAAAHEDSRAPAHEDAAARAYLFMLSGSLAFALMGAFGHLAGERVDWRLVACARTLLAFVFSAALALSTGVRLVVFRPAILWVRSVAGSFGLLCYFYAVTHLPVSTALTLTNTVPVWVTLLAWPVLGQRPAGSDWLAVSVGVAGVALVQRPQLSGGDATAAALALASALGTAVAMLGLNRLGAVDARAVVAHFSAVSTIFALAFLLLTGGAAARDAAARADAGVLALLLGVGAAGTLGQLAMTRAYALGSAARVAVVGLTQIVFALAFDLVLWRRPFDALTLAGIALVVAPSAWLTLRRPLRPVAQIHTTS